MIDGDFDGALGKLDFKNFLLEVLRIPRGEITSLRIERLLKLLDVWKRGRVLLDDFA
jgi:hypothetical protein